MTALENINNLNFDQYRVGELLKHHRELLGFSQKEVAEHTKIRTVYIKAIEDEAFDVIPGLVYIKGFLKTYSQFLGLDADHILNLYTENHSGSVPVQPYKVYLPRQKRNFLNFWTIFLSLLMALGTVGYWWYLQKNNVLVDSESHAPLAGQSLPLINKHLPRPPVAPMSSRSRSPIDELDVEQDEDIDFVIDDDDDDFTALSDVSNAYAHDRNP